MMMVTGVLCAVLTIGASYSRYDPNRGYYWEFPNESSQQGQKESSSDAASRPENPSDTQRRRVDNLLSDFTKKFTPKAFAKRVSEAVKESWCAMDRRCITI